ncbi:hypothetical protein ACHAWF_003852 [Thalassiosira exigua]
MFIHSKELIESKVIMTYRWRGRSSNEFMAAIIFAGFLAGFIFYLCVGNYQRAKRAMDRQRKRRLELEEEKRALAFSPVSGGGGSIGGSSRRRINFNGNGAFDSPRSGYSGSSSMYTDEKGLTVGVGGVQVAGNGSHMLLGGDHAPGGAQFAVPQQQNQVAQPPIDLLDDDDGGVNGYGTLIEKTPSQGEMSV